MAWLIIHNITEDLIPDLTTSYVPSPKPVALEDVSLFAINSSPYSIQKWRKFREIGKFVTFNCKFDPEDVE